MDRGPALELDVPALHQAQRKALYDAKERRIGQRRLEIKARFRPTWAFLFRQHEQEKRELDRTRRRAFSRLVYWIQHGQDIKSRGGLAGAFQALLGNYGPDFADAMHTRHEAARKALALRVSEAAREAIAQENESLRTEMDMLKHDQAAERQTLTEAYAKQTRTPGISDGRGAEKSHEETQRGEKQTVCDEFRSRVRKRIRKARKRDQRGKGAGRERGD